MPTEKITRYFRATKKQPKASYSPMRTAASRKRKAAADAAAKEAAEGKEKEGMVVVGTPKKARRLPPNTAPEAAPAAAPAKPRPAKGGMEALKKALSARGAGRVAPGTLARSQANEGSHFLRSQVATHAPDAPRAAISTAGVRSIAALYK